MKSLLAFIPAFLMVVSWDGASIRGTVKIPGRDNRDAVVYLENIPGTFKAPAAPIQIDQKKMVFVPHVLPVVIGTTVEFLNSDSVLHNVYTPSKAGDKFNLGTWPQGQTKKYTFTKLGEVAVLCNVHPDMEAWVVVLSNPYFAKTEASGDFVIPNVPAGNYLIKVWHKKYRAAAQQVTVPGNGDVAINFTLSK